MQTLGNLYQVFTSDRILKYVSNILSVKKNLITFTEPALRLDGLMTKEILLVGIKILIL